MEHMKSSGNRILLLISWTIFLPHCILFYFHLFLSPPLLLATAARHVEWFVCLLFFFRHCFVFLFFFYVSFMFAVQRAQSELRFVRYTAKSFSRGLHILDVRFFDQFTLSIYGKQFGPRYRWVIITEKRNLWNKNSRVERTEYERLFPGCHW